MILSESVINIFYLFDGGKSKCVSVPKILTDYFAYVLRHYFIYAKQQQIRAECFVILNQSCCGAAFICQRLLVKIIFGATFCSEPTTTTATCCVYNTMPV